mmetsp:Transcript_19293/g.35484  ORF Transcript_19293/g.35484 Transcript_19293/m.35484 type:complete len:278 (-) Transcript_19293:1421-2254(-)|eukprot:CAMPEP_0204907000 /NCGR_PEP_ID=MMETSP1397-20131031/6267_1 /ASSEMBLY_ACC=CAM_ASM_000891 /TAXON_ID=49980 /ORGANISM="Climacostomum Climacostomum virens, Strain Stock W-24" /LENGTH=277 /DNA_ID=CAMNT_0052076013 /DNA_START=1796 /DNA_END=2629 /DNA_ORIENTATION=-
MEARYKRFLEYDFEKSKGWKRFLKTFPYNPAKDQIPLFQRKWYKDYIDNEFDIEYQPPPPQPDMSTYKPIPTNTGTPNFLGLVEVILFIMLVPAYLSNKGLYFAIAAFLCGLLSNTGMPEWSSNYASLVTFSDDLHSLVFCLMFMIYPSSMWLLPVAIGAASRVSEILTKFEGTPSFLKGLMAKLYASKFELEFNKAQVEVGMGIATLFIALSGGHGIIFGFAYFNFLRMKHLVNRYTGDSFTTLRVVGDAYFVSGPLKVVWEKVKWAVGALAVAKA